MHPCPCERSRPGRHATDRATAAGAMQAPRCTRYLRCSESLRLRRLSRPPPRTSACAIHDLPVGAGVVVEEVDHLPTENAVELRGEPVRGCAWPPECLSSPEAAREDPLTYLLAIRCGCMQTGCMTSITIRDVPDEVRDELAARARLSGRSLQEYLRTQLVALASRPDPGSSSNRRARARSAGEVVSPRNRSSHTAITIAGDRGRRCVGAGGGTRRPWPRP